jgi:hypothetical protein
VGALPGDDGAVFPRGFAVRAGCIEQKPADAARVFSFYIPRPPANEVHGLDGNIKRMLRGGRHMVNQLYLY